MATDKDSLYLVGSLVFAKVKGHPYWPAEIKTIYNNDNNRKYEVTFFGDNTTALLKLNDICLYSEYKQVHGKHKTDNFKNKNFNTALKLAEAAFKLQTNHSPAEIGFFDDLRNKEISLITSAKIDTDLDMNEIHTKIISMDNQENVDLEASLTLAAEAGNALLSENQILKQDLERINMENSKLKAKIFELESRIQLAYDEQIPKLEDEREHILFRNETLQNMVQEMETQARKEKELKEELIRTFEEHDKGKEEIILTLEKNIDNLLHEINLKKKSETTNDPTINNRILKNSETQTSTNEHPMNTNSCLLTQLTELKFRQDKMERLVETIQIQTHDRPSNIIDQKTININPTPGASQTRSEKLKHPPTVNETINDTQSTPRVRQTTSKKLTYCRLPSNIAQKIKQTEQRPKQNMFSVSLQVSKHHQKQSHLVENPQTPPLEISLQTAKDTPNQPLKTCKNPPEYAIIRKESESIEDFFHSHIEFYKNTFSKHQNREQTPQGISALPNHFLDQTARPKERHKI